MVSNAVKVTRQNDSHRERESSDCIYVEKQFEILGTTIIEINQFVICLHKPPSWESDHVFKTYDKL